METGEARIAAVEPRLEILSADRKALACMHQEDRIDGICHAHAKRAEARLHRCRKSTDALQRMIESVADYFVTSSASSGPAPPPPGTFPATSVTRGCSSNATRPLQPVWCDAPTPRPVSP